MLQPAGPRTASWPTRRPGPSTSSPPRRWRRTSWPSCDGLKAVLRPSAARPTPTTVTRPSQRGKHPQDGPDRRHQPGHAPHGHPAPPHPLGALLPARCATSSWTRCTPTAASSAATWPTSSAGSSACARFYGAAPQFICCSATIANPRELAERLTEEPVTLVDQQRTARPAGEKHFVLQPAAGGPRAGHPPQLGRRCAGLLAERFLGADIQTIVFARSRLGTELLLTYLRGRRSAKAGRWTRYRATAAATCPPSGARSSAACASGTWCGRGGTNALELGHRHRPAWTPAS